MFENFGGFDKEILSIVSRASVVGLHIVSGTIVGGVMGWAIDTGLFGRFPWWGSAVMLVAGIVAGFRNAWMDTKKIILEQEQEDAKRKSAAASKNQKLPPDAR
jgi:ATP synthase protein I